MGEHYMIIGTAKCSRLYRPGISWTKFSLMAVEYMHSSALTSLMCKIVIEG